MVLSQCIERTWVKYLRASSLAAAVRTGNLMSF